MELLATKFNAVFCKIKDLLRGLRSDVEANTEALSHAVMQEQIVSTNSESLTDIPNVPLVNSLIDAAVGGLINDDVVGGGWTPQGEIEWVGTKPVEEYTFVPKENDAFINVSEPLEIWHFKDATWVKDVTIEPRKGWMYEAVHILDEQNLAGRILWTQDTNGEVLYWYVLADTNHTGDGVTILNNANRTMSVNSAYMEDVLSDYVPIATLNEILDDVIAIFEEEE